MELAIGAFAIIIASIGWSFDGVLIRPNFSEFSVLNIVFLEHFFWAILLSPILFWWWNKTKKITPEVLFWLLWVSFFWGLIGTFMITKAYFAAYTGETTLSTIIILQKLQPVFAIGLAALFLKERLTSTFYIWSLIAIVAAYMIAFETLGRDVLSLNFLSNPSFYALLAAFAFGSSTVYGKKLVMTLGFQLSTSLRFIFTAIMACIAVLIFWDIASVTELNGEHWVLLAILVCTTGSLWLFLYYYWLRKVPASSATIYELAFPLSWVFFDWYFNEKLLTGSQVLFSCILFISFFVIMQETYRLEKKASD
jgi:drug/metabolite transporter (DMT)-like permease